MQVTLKKAAELSRAAINASKTIEFKKAFSISAFISMDDFDIGQIVGTGQLALTDAVSRSLALVDAGYEIRALIGDANAKAGVSGLLTKTAAIDETIQRLTLIVTETGSAVACDDLFDVKLRFHKMRTDTTAQTETPRFGATDRLTVSAISEAAKLNYLNDMAVLRRKRSAIKDELTAINFITKVTIPDHIVEVLRAEKVID